MDFNSNLYDEIKDMIVQETRWLRVYSSKVVSTNDPINKARVLVAIPEMGQENEADGFWAWCIDPSLQSPNIGDWVTVGFLNADPQRPYYSGIVSSIKDQGAKKYTGVKDCVIFEDRKNSSNNIVFDRDENKLIICDGTESYVKGDTVKVELQKIVDQLTQLKTDISAWSPIAGDGGAAFKTVLSAGFSVKPDAVLTSILSETVKAK